MDTKTEDQVIQTQLTQGRSDWPDEPLKITTASIDAQIEDFFYEAYLRYFKTAESRRRWSIDHDIPWAEITDTASETTAIIVESFSAVEMFLPDYTHKITDLVRKSRGRALFQANWGYEESKHSMVLDMWLERSGKRTEDQIAEFERSLLGAEWKLPFESPRQMICYTMIQELATGVNYTNLRERAESEGDVCLARVLRWVAADESAHYNFFRKGVKAFMELDPEGTVKDIKWVFDHFTMPAHALIPEWDERGQVIEEAGVYGPKVYLGKVRRPVIEDLALTREQLRGTGLTDAEVQEIADKEDERQEALRLGQYKRFTTIATSPRYQHPQRTVISTIP